MERSDPDAPPEWKGALTCCCATLVMIEYFFEFKEP